MCGCLDKELTEFPLIKSRIYLCIMTTNARTRVAPKIILSFLYIPGLYYIISMGLIWTEREAQWERERESIFETHTSTHTICVWMRYIPVLRYMFSPTLPNSLLLLPGLWPLRQVLAHFCATLASSELHFCITDTKKFTLTKYHKKCKKKIPRTKLLRGSYLRKPAVSEHASLLASPKPTGFSLLRAV